MSKPKQNFFQGLEDTHRNFVPSNTKFLIQIRFLQTLTRHSFDPLHLQCIFHFIQFNPCALQLHRQNLSIYQSVL